MPSRSFFKINRDTPEAKANQIEWARKQMDLEVPEVTAAGNEIQDREDFVRQACYSLVRPRRRADGRLPRPSVPWPSSP